MLEIGMYLYWGNSLTPVTDTFWEEHNKRSALRISWLAEHCRSVQIIRRAAPPQYDQGSWWYPFGLEILFRDPEEKQAYRSVFPGGLVSPKLFG